MRIWGIAVAVLLLLAVPLGFARAASAGDGGAPADKTEQVRTLLGSPDVKAFIAALNDPATRAALTANGAPPADEAALLFGKTLITRLAEMRANIVRFFRSLPGLPDQVRYAFANLTSSLPRDALLRGLVGLIVLPCIGAVAVVATITLFRPWRKRISEAIHDTASRRALIVLERLAYSFVLLGTWAVSTMGGFMMVSWEPAVGALLLGYLTACLLIGVSLVSSRFILAPRAARFRLLPIPTSAAWFWHGWLATLTAIGALGWQTAAVVRAFGADPTAVDALSHLVGLVIVLCGVAVGWFGDYRARLEPRRAAIARGLALFMSFYPPLVWLMFVAGAAPLGWMMIAIAAGPLAVYLIHHTIAGVEQGVDLDISSPTSAWAILVERVLQGIVLFAALCAVLRISGMGFDMLAERDTPEGRLLSGIVEAALILYAAELTWQITRAVIDTHLHRIAIAAATFGDEAELRRRARLRTLLPVARSFILIAVAAVSVMTAVGALGVQIAPLLAGAGVVGVAIGLGAQALVRDVISGVFFLLDDAFRVGEYIETGPIRGSVESFSLRSIKLRDYRGQLHTLPFGEVRTVTNYSREWISEEMQIGVRHDTDLDLVDQAIQEVSDALMADDDIKALIIDPLRSTGVSGISDHALRISIVFRTRPGDQYVVRAKAYRLIQKIFLAQGIHLASPTLVIEDRVGAFAAPHQAPATPS